MLRDRHRLVEILIAAAQIEKYIESKSIADFYTDNMLHDAVGESVSRLSPDFRTKHPDVDWTLGHRHRPRPGPPRPTIPNPRHRISRRRLTPSTDAPPPKNSSLRNGVQSFSPIGNAR